MSEVMDANVLSIVLSVRKQKVVVEGCCRMGKVQGRNMEREGYLYVGRMRVRKLTGDCSRDRRKGEKKGRRVSHVLIGHSP